MKIQLPCYLEQKISEKTGEPFYWVIVRLTEKTSLKPIFLSGAELELALDRYGDNASKKIKLDANSNKD